jgi:hypothetical protein
VAAARHNVRAMHAGRPEAQARGTEQHNRADHWRVALCGTHCCALCAQRAGLAGWRGRASGVHAAGRHCGACSHPLYRDRAAARASAPASRAGCRCRVRGHVHGRAASVNLTRLARPQLLYQVLELPGWLERTLRRCQTRGGGLFTCPLRTGSKRPASSPAAAADVMCGQACPNVARGALCGWGQRVRQLVLQCTLCDWRLMENVTSLARCTSSAQCPRKVGPASPGVHAWQVGPGGAARTVMER